MTNSTTPEQIQLTNEEISGVFAMYATTYLDFCLLYHTNMQEQYANILEVIGKPHLLHNWRLLLTPLSKISDEDAIEVAKFHIPIFKGLEVPKGSDLERQTIREGKKSVQYCYSAVLFQYLIQKGYACPIFIAPGHALNGKNPIELGLAIDKTIL